MKTVSSWAQRPTGRATTNPRILGQVHDPWQQAVAGVAHVQLDAAVDETGAGDALHLGSSSSASALVGRESAPYESVGVDALLERRRGVEGEDLAVVHDRHTVAELVRLLHVVGREQDRLALLVQLAEELPQREPALRVEAGSRLVHEEDRRPVEDRPGDHEPLRHPAGQGMNVAVAHFESRNCSSSSSLTRRASRWGTPNRRPWK